jgi:NADPH:quinone reductase-like Zn-dependent oxidoreductase
MTEDPFQEPAMASDTDSMQAFEVRRDSLGDTRLVTEPVPEPAPGQVVLRVDAFALTANNITYGVAGDTIGYWQFFPAGDGGEDWGRIPVWGFGDVIRSSVHGVGEGARFYGYFPMASHLVVKPERVSERGFTDGATHRAALPPVYNQYTATAADPAYRADQEAMQMLFRPLFTTSFFLDDFLHDNDFFGASTVVLSSASSKTSFGLAWLLHRNRRDRCRVVGLTSPGHVGFVESLGCYDHVVTYEDLASLPRDPAVFVDMAGNAELRAALHRHYGDALAHSCSVGATHWQQARLSDDTPLPGPKPTLFFAPSQIQKRAREWGAAGMAERTAAAWAPFVAAAGDWIDVRRERGADAVSSIYQEVLHNRNRPPDGFILSL